MNFYQKIFLGFFCFIKKVLPKEEQAEAYATGLMTGAASFIYFAVTLFFMQRATGLWETAGVFFVLFGAHFMMFANKGLTENWECSDKWIYRSLLYFFTTLSILMYVTTL